MASISVYITSYNQRDLLDRAIASVLAQTLPANQIIVVDDCSNDGSQDLIADYARKHAGLFTPIYHRRNTGVAPARADALAAVTGDLVTYVDGDDRYLPTKLEREAAALDASPDADIAFSNNRWVSPDGGVDYLWITDESPPEGDVFAETFARAYPRRMLFRMELARYDAWKRVGFHDSRLPIFEDWEMRIRLTRRLRTVYVDEVLSEITLHGEGLSSTKAETYLEVIDRIVKADRHLLDELPGPRRRWVLKELKSWIALTQNRAARERIEAGDRLGALAHYLGALNSCPRVFNADLTAQLLLPGPFYRRLKSAYRRRAGGSRGNS